LGKHNNLLDLLMSETPSQGSATAPDLVFVVGSLGLQTLARA